MVTQSNYQTKLPIQRGFTLIEIMIVVTIIGVLAAIAYPSYQGYVERTNRADMMAEMQQIASRIESNKINYKRYEEFLCLLYFRVQLLRMVVQVFPVLVMLYIQSQ